MSPRGGGDKLLGNLSDEQLFSKGGYDLDTWKGVANLKNEDGWNSLLAKERMAIQTSRSKMTRDTKELERMLEELEKLGQLVSKTTWDEVTDLWDLMHQNYRKLGCERALVTKLAPTPG